MATTQVVWGRAGSETFGTPVPSFNSPGNPAAVSETLHPTVVNQITLTGAIASAQRMHARVTTDTAAYVKFGRLIMADSGNTADSTTTTADSTLGGLYATNDSGGGRFMMAANRSEIFEVNPGDHLALALYVATITADNAVLKADSTLFTADFL